jgi:two-component system, OmpR family, sensor histidine kinase KdpD
MFSRFRYLQSMGLVAVATLLGVPIRALLHPTNLVMLYMAAVVIAAFFLGRGPSMLAAFVSVLAFDYFYVDPRLSFTVADTEYLVTFAGLLVVGLVVSGLAARVREQLAALRDREIRVEALNDLGRDLTAAFTLDEMLRAVVRHVSQTLSREVVVLIPDHDVLEQRAATLNFSLEPSELETARWAFVNAQAAGIGTDHFPQARVRYVPLKTMRGVMGILGVRPPAGGAVLTLAQRQQLEGFAHLAAMSIERARLAEEANRAQVLDEAEKLQTALLNSISHDLRTPLVSIQGVLDSLLEVEEGGENAVVLDHPARLDMLENAREETARLNRLVENLLDMTRLEAGTLKLRLEPGDLQDVIGSALAHLDEPYRRRPVNVSLVEKLPLIPMDFVLMEQVLVNLLDNAAKYSPPGAPVEINVSCHNNEVLLRISDRGPGIPPSELKQVFDKFHRVSIPGRVKGLGLGLSICKGIVEAHEGRIWAENRPGGGSAFNVALPLEHAKRSAA